MQPKDAESGRGVARYYTVPADGVKHPNVALVLFTDFFGFNIVRSCRLSHYLTEAVAKWENPGGSICRQARRGSLCP